MFVKLERTVLVAIIDYNMGNLASVYNACKLIGVKADIVNDPSRIKEYDRVILPGVGAFQKFLVIPMSGSNRESSLESMTSSGR